MERLACPLCGSEFFVSRQTGDRAVFQVSTGHEPIVLAQEQESEVALAIDVRKIYCGACSWKGALELLVESRM